MTKYILFTLILLSVQSSFSQLLVPAQDPIEVEELRFSPDHAIGGYYADFIESITFIPLEYSKDSKVQYNPRIMILDSTIVIANLMGLAKNQELLFYKKDGSYIKKIDNFQNICSACKNLLSISKIDADKDNIYLKVFIPGLQKPINIIKLDHQGNFVNTDNIEANNFLKLGDSILVYNSQRDGNIDALVLIDEENHSDTLVKYDSSIILSDDATLMDIDKGISFNGEKIYFTAPYNNKFYQYSKKLQLEKAYNLILPLKYSLPSDNIRQVFTDGFLKNNPDVMIGINQIQPIGDKLIIQLSFANTKKSTFIYNIASGEWIKLNSLVPDSASSQVPILESSGTIYAHSNDLYTIIYPNMVKSYFEQSRQLNVLKNPEIASLVKELNPILVKFNLKK